LLDIKPGRIENNNCFLQNQENNWCAWGGKGNLYSESESSQGILHEVIIE